MTIPAGFSQHTLIFSGTGLPHGAAVTYGVDNTGFSSIEQEGQDCRDAWILNVLPLQHTELVLDALVVKRGPDATGPLYVAGSTSPGLLSGASMTPNVAALVRKGTDLGGRKNRGRMYVPGMLETNVAGDGGLANVYRGDLQDGIDDWAVAVAAAGGIFKVLHGDSTPPTTITSFTVDGTVATQRRRLRR